MCYDARTNIWQAGEVTDLCLGGGAGDVSLSLRQTCNLSQTLHGYDFRIILFTQETLKLQQAMFPTKQRKIYLK